MGRVGSTSDIDRLEHHCLLPTPWPGCTPIDRPHVAILNRILLSDRSKSALHLAMCCLHFARLNHERKPLPDVCSFASIHHLWRLIHFCYQLSLIGHGKAILSVASAGDGLNAAVEREVAV